MTTPQLAHFSNFPTVSTKLDVTIGESRWKAASWSVAGVTVIGGLSGLIDGAVYPATLRFGSETTLEIHTTVKVQIGKDMSRLIFLDISYPHAELLHKLVDDHRHGSEDDLLHLLETANDNQSPPSRAARVIARRLRIAVTFLFTGTLLAVAAWLLYVTLATVSSTQAAVSADSRKIFAPVSGTLFEALPPPGTKVEKGQVIGTINSADVLHRLSSLDADEIRLEGSITLARERLAELEALAGAESGKLQAAKAATKAKLDLAAQRLTIENRHLDRMRKLGDVASQRNTEEQLVQVLSVTEQIKVLDREMADIDARLATLSTNPASTDLTANTLTTSSLETAIATDMASLALLRKERATLLDRTVLRSPCDCVVNAVAAQPGDIVAEKDTLGILVDPASTLIQALIPVASASGLRNGDPVSVELADRRRFAGEVIAISYQPRAENRIGLSERIAEELHARLDIRVSDLEPADIGMIAQIRAHSRKLSELFGWDLVRNLLK